MGVAMNLNIQSKYLKKHIKFALFATFTLSFTLYPFTKSPNTKTVTTASCKTSKTTGMDKPSTRTVYHSTHQFLPAKQNLSVFEYIQEIGKDNKQLWHTLQQNTALILLFGMSFLIYAFLSSFRRITKHVSILALSIGGHAPPYVFFLKEYD